jgi:hypothetical protein
MAVARVSPAAVDKLAERTPRTVVKWYDIDHFQAFCGERVARIAADQGDWLRQTLLAGNAPKAAGVPHCSESGGA